MFSVIFAVQLLITSLAVAAPGFSSSDFQTNPYHVAHVTQPMWHFLADSCYPQAANDGGLMHQPHLASGCWGTFAGAGCEHSIPWSGPNQKGPNVPTYYHVSHCDQDDTWRIYYGLYFDHDIGHSHDWEWVVVVFKNFGGIYFRDHIIMEQDGENAQYSWTDSHVQTFDDANDMWALGNGANKNHPKVYVTKQHHSMWPNPCSKDSILTGLCDGTFRRDDWYMFDFSNESNLVDIATPVDKGGIDPSWNFGSASNPWWTVWGMCTMCTATGDYAEDCGISIPLKCAKMPSGACNCGTIIRASGQSEHALQKQDPSHKEDL